MSKKKTPDSRNPIAPVLRDPMFRKRIAKSEEEKIDQKDPWSKKAKYKKQTLDEFYQVGDKVDIISGPLKKVLDRAEALRKKKNTEKGQEPGEKKIFHTKENEAVVREPNGPGTTIGITINGEYHLVDEEEVELIYEAFEYTDLTEWSYADTTSGIRIPISNEEQEVLNKCGSNFYKSNMDDREQELARRMVSRGVLHRHKDDVGIYFTADNKKLKRF